MTSQDTYQYDLDREWAGYLSFFVDHDLVDIYETQSVDRTALDINPRLGNPRLASVTPLRQNLNKPQNTITPLVAVKHSALRPETIKNFDLDASILKATTLSATLQTFDQLYECLDQFTDMPLRYEGGKSIIKGRGTLNPQLMIIGEAPTRDEDDTGLAFSGAQGRLIDAVLRCAKLSQSHYICHSVFWRPAGDRPIVDEDISLNAPFVKAMISIVKPRKILLLGPLAVKTVLGSNIGLSKLRGQPLKLVPDKIINENMALNTDMAASYAATFLLRQPQAKGLFWHDLLSLLNTNPDV